MPPEGWGRERGTSEGTRPFTQGFGVAFAGQSVSRFATNIIRKGHDKTEAEGGGRWRIYGGAALDVTVLSDSEALLQTKSSGLRQGL